MTTQQALKERRSNALIEVGDTFWFNGLRGQNDLDRQQQLYVAGITVEGKLEILISHGPDDKFMPAGLRVPIERALNLIDTNVWQPVENTRI